MAALGLRRRGQGKLRRLENGGGGKKKKKEGGVVCSPGEPARNSCRLRSAVKKKRNFGGERGGRSLVGGNHPLA